MIMQMVQKIKMQSIGISYGWNLFFLISSYFSPFFISYFSSNQAGDLYIQVIANQNNQTSNILHLELTLFTKTMTNSSDVMDYWDGYMNMNTFSPGDSFSNDGFWYGNCSTYVIMKHKTSYSTPLTVELTVMSYVRNGLLVSLNNRGVVIKNMKIKPL